MAAVNVRQSWINTEKVTAARHGQLVYVTVCCVPNYCDSASLTRFQNLESEDSDGGIGARVGETFWECKKNLF